MNKAKLIQAIKKEKRYAADDFCEQYAEKIIKETDGRLLANVEQWLEGEPLEDIRIGKYSIKLIMEIRGNHDFFSALEAMSNCIANPEFADAYIWRFKR